MEPFSLSDLNYEVSRLVKEGFDYCWVTAEIQKISENAFSGHCYLELVEKDSDGKTLAQAKATIWKSVYASLKPYFIETAKMPLSAGMKILVYVKPVFSEVYGYSLNVTDIDPSYTVGNAALERERTIQQLKADKVFDLNKQCPMPLLVKRIALVSSPTAAGREDFLQQLAASDFNFHIEEFEAQMQGDGAEDSIIAALDAVAEGDFDAVVIVRGGGAVSDLQCFDSYRLCFYCAQFPIPIVAGIGHHRDQSVLDLVAAFSLKTPTAAAQFLVDRAEAALDKFVEQFLALQNAVKTRLESASQRLADCKLSLNYAADKLLYIAASRVDAASSAIMPAAVARLRAGEQRLQLLCKDVEMSNPDRILSKGYCIVEKNGTPVTAADLCAEDVVLLRFADGKSQAQIKN